MSDHPAGEPDVILMLGGSAIAFTQKGEIVETVEFNAFNQPIWDNASICDPRGGGGGRGFDALGRAMQAAEENYELVFNEKPARLPD